MGKFFALIIIVFMAVWLAPMCAKLPEDLSTVAAPAPAVVAAPAVSTVTAPAPAPVAAPPKPAPAAAHGSLTVTTYRSRKPFPVENGKYVVSVIRANKGETPAVGVRLTLTARLKGEIVERAESGPAQSLAAGTTSYFGLGISTVVFDELLDGPEDRRNGLEWSLTYRFEKDAPGKTRCYRLRALPRRRPPEGLGWLPLGDSQACE